MLSFALSFACGCLPGIASLSDGTRTILLTVLISCRAAVLFLLHPKHRKLPELRRCRHDLQ